MPTTIRDIEPHMLAYDPLSAPHGNPDGRLAGVTGWRELLDGDMFLTGQRADITGPFAGHLPLLIGGDCGPCRCGAVWTRSAVSGGTVIRDGWGLMNYNAREPLRESSEFHFEIGACRDAFSAARPAAHLP